MFPRGWSPVSGVGDDGQSPPSRRMASETSYRGGGIRPIVAVDAPSRIQLQIGGMSCASCAARVEKKLNRLDGVDATVNYATELASVDFDPRRQRLEDLIETVEATGYSAALPADDGTSVDLVKPLRIRLLASVALTIPLVLLAAVPPLQFSGWEWLAFALATPIVLLGRLLVPPRGVTQRAPFHGDHGHPDLDRDACRVGLVRGRPPREDQRRRVLRSCRRDHDADPARSLISRRAPAAVRARLSARC